MQAGTKSWKAFFFGSLDSSSFITVDKPPASLWVKAHFKKVTIADRTRYDLTQRVS